MSEFIRQSSPQELSDFHRELLQGFQRLAEPPEPPKPQPEPPKPKSQAPAVKIVRKAKPKKEKPPKQTHPKAVPISELVSRARPVKQGVVNAIAQFLQDGKEATVDQMIAASQVHRNLALAAIDWMQEERLIVRCGSCPTRYRRP